MRATKGDVVSAWFALISAGCLFILGVVAQVRLRMQSTSSRAARLNAVGLTFGGAGTAVNALPTVAGWSGALQDADGILGGLLAVTAVVLILRGLRLSYTDRHPASQQPAPGPAAGR